MRRGFDGELNPGKWLRDRRLGALVVRAAGRQGGGGPAPGAAPGWPGSG
jgi:uncharacterized membrane protein